MKIANIILDGRFGGPQNRILQVAKRLSKFGIETIVVLPEQDSGVFYEKLIKNGVSLQKMKLHRPTREKQHLIRGIISFLPELLFLYRYLKKNQIRFVHCNGIWQITGIIASKIAGAKIILHLNDTWDAVGIRMLFRIFGPLCNAYILASERTRQCYFNIKQINKPYVLIYPPVDTAYFDPEKVLVDEKIKNYPGLKIVTIGNITPTKGFETFISMANVLNKRHENLTFHVVGPCYASQEKYLSKLRGLIHSFQLKNVFFHGKSDNIPSVLKATDIFVCTSQSESGPMTVWEAMSMQKAIVSTDVGDVKNLIKDGESGFVVPPLNVEAIAEKVSILIGNEKLQSDFGKKARAIAVEKLDIEICVKRHKQFYNEIFGIGGRGD